jgi:hypothetical protein
MTAKDVLDLMKKNLGGPWNGNTYRDVFHAGDGNVEVKGIATTFMSTLDVLQRAHAAGLNMVIPHETTFWNDRDETRDLTDDPVYKFKTEFCAKNNMVVLRFHDHAHSHRPDFIMVGLVSGMPSRFPRDVSGRSVAPTRRRAPRRTGAGGRDSSPDRARWSARPPAESPGEGSRPPQGYHAE